jgi:hypothetical protein
VREIPWEKVESTRTDLRRITTYAAFGHFVENENRLVLSGNGTSIAFNTTRYEAVAEDLLRQLERARPFAVAATMQHLRNDGVARLGPVELRRDAVLISRLAARGRRRISPLVHVLTGLLTFGLWFIAWGLSAAIRAARGPIRVPLESILDVTFEKGDIVIVTDRRIHLPMRRVPNGAFFPELLSGIPGVGFSDPAADEAAYAYPSGRDSRTSQ